jgi:hypothetical protein
MLKILHGMNGTAVGMLCLDVLVSGRKGEDSQTVLGNTGRYEWTRSGVSNSRLDRGQIQQGLEMQTLVWTFTMQQQLGPYRRQGLVPILEVAAML